MKESIQLLANMSDQTITHFTLDEVRECLEQFNHLELTMSKCYKTFQDIDTDKTPERTNQLIENHASGKVIKAMGSFLQFFPNASANDEGDTLGKLQLMAQSYKDYSQHKAVLAAKKDAVQKHMEQLENKNDSVRSCSML